MYETVSADDDQTEAQQKEVLLIVSSHVANRYSNASSYQHRNLFTRS